MQQVHRVEGNLNICRWTRWCENTSFLEICLIPLDLVWKIGCGPRGTCLIWINYLLSLQYSRWNAHPEAQIWKRIWNFSSSTFFLSSVKSCWQIAEVYLQAAVWWAYSPYFVYSYYFAKVSSKSCGWEYLPDVAARRWEMLSGTLLFVVNVMTLCLDNEQNWDTLSCWWKGLWVQRLLLKKKCRQCFFPLTVSALSVSSSLESLAGWAKWGASVYVGSCRLWGPLCLAGTISWSGGRTAWPRVRESPESWLLGVKMEMSFCMIQPKS